MTQQVVITEGIPASGKPEWAKARVAASPKTRGRVNRDDIRRSVFGASHGVDERAVTWIERATIRVLLDAGKDVVVDATNLNPKFRDGLHEWLQNYTERSGRELDIKAQKFTVPLRVAIERDATREHPVGADVITSFHDRYNSAA